MLKLTSFELLDVDFVFRQFLSDEVKEPRRPKGGFWEILQPEQHR